jgi:hypothetical protein
MVRNYWKVLVTLSMKKKIKKLEHPGNRTPVSTVGGYYDTNTPGALCVSVLAGMFIQW